MVVLDETEVDACLSIPIPAVGLQEKAALVSVDDGVDPDHPGQGSFTDSDYRGHACIVIIVTDMLRYTLRI
jgi:hypothetical protein